MSKTAPPVLDRVIIILRTSFNKINTFNSMIVHCGVKNYDSYQTFKQKVTCQFEIISCPSFISTEEMVSYFKSMFTSLCGKKIPVIMKHGLEQILFSVKKKIYRHCIILTSDEEMTSFIGCAFTGFWSVSGVSAQLS